MISSVRSVSLNELIRVSSGNSRLRMPVSRSQAPYARLKHVMGIPSSEPGKSMNISKLKALDNYIDRLQPSGKTPSIYNSQGASRSLPGAVGKMVNILA